MSEHLPPTADCDAPDLAGVIRDARSTEAPCGHWIGQGVAVCSLCLRDRVLASEQWVSLVRTARAGAWDEGYRAGIRSGESGYIAGTWRRIVTSTNPYRRVKPTSVIPPGSGTLGESS